MREEYSDVVEKVCSLISEGSLSDAEAVINSDYPFIPIKKSGRSYTQRQMTKIFLRDGFIDRYKGTRLVYPPALRVITKYLPVAFPYHKNWKMDQIHIAYWELLPTIDHIDPVGRGGADSEDKWFSCSMLTNSIKSNWTMEQLGWSLLPAGDLSDWDGMFQWFLDQVVRDPSLLEVPYIKLWFNAARSATI